MGVTVKHLGSIPVDRNVARIEIMCESDKRDDWQIILHFQDAPYDDQDKRLDEPRFGTEQVAVSYGDIKGKDLPTGGKVRDLFEPIRQLAYALRTAQIERRAAQQAAQQAAQSQSPAP